MNNEQLTEIQYCEDCANFEPFTNGSGETPPEDAKRLAVCKVSPMTEQMVYRTDGKFQFCTNVREYKQKAFHTCSKFKPKENTG